MTATNGDPEPEDCVLWRYTTCELDCPVCPDRKRKERIWSAIETEIRRDPAMTLTPMMKFILIAVAFTINVGLLIWNGIKIDVLAIGMREEVFNIGLTVLTTLNAGTGALLVYLGLKAPTVERGS